MSFNDVINTSIKAPLWFCRSIGVTPPQRTHLHFKWELNWRGGALASKGSHPLSLLTNLLMPLWVWVQRSSLRGQTPVLQQRESWLLTGQADQLVFSAISSKAYFYFDFIPRPSSFLIKSAEQGGTGWDHVLCRCDRHKCWRGLVVRCQWPESK